MGYIKQKFLSGFAKEQEVVIQAVKPKTKAKKEITIQEVDVDETTARKKSLSNGKCIYCDKTLSRSEFRDSEGELTGWIVECLNCERVYDED